MSIIGISLSSMEKELIIKSWKTIMQNPNKFSDTFYTKLFELDPNMKYLFKNDLKVQRIKFVDSINYLARRMEDLEETTNKMKKLGLKHKGYMVKEGHYPIFGDALIYSFEHHLGEEFDDKSKTAWIKLYDSVAEFMIKGTKRN